MTNEIGLRLTRKTDEPTDEAAMLAEVRAVLVRYGFTLSQWGAWENMRAAAAGEQSTIDRHVTADVSKTPAGQMMTIDALIEWLAAAKAEHGDVPVCLETDTGDYALQADEIKIKDAGEGANIPGKRVAIWAMYGYD